MTQDPHKAKKEVTFRVYRGDNDGGTYKNYSLEVEDGLVVLDCIHEIQATQATDLACRWNCKAGKCGSCSMEINGKPKLACMTRMSSFEDGDLVTIRPIKAFPVIKDLVTDVSWNYDVAKKITPFTPKEDARWNFKQEDIERSQEFKKCIECFMCQNTCHILRDHQMKDKFSGPRFMAKVAELEMHPVDGADRTEFLHTEGGVGYCNITKCCTDVCPEHINITDNAIIPLKERVVDRYYDPLKWIWRKIFG